MIEVTNVNIKDIIPYKNNPRLIDDEAVDKVAESIKQFGFKVPIIVDSDNVIVTGHTRRLAALKLNLTEVPVIKADDLTPEQIKMFRLADNKVAEYSTWDFSKLETELAEFETAEFEVFGFEEEEETPLSDDNEPDGLDAEKYTTKIDIPQYTPKLDRPVEISEMLNRDKTLELLKEIEEADIPDDVKNFLTMAAYRHLKFNYKMIAEYYAQAPKEVQELMENSALVIIDFDNALRNGFVRMTEKLNALIGEPEV